MRKAILVLALLCCAVSHAAEPAAVYVAVPDGRRVALSPALLAHVPRQTVSATAHGKTASYEGYDLRAVLAAAGVAPIEAIRGKRLGNYVAVTATDGYRVVFGLGELDPTLGNRLVLLADRENGRPLPPGDGAWRLVVPGDRRPARWERQVVSIRVAD
ncbi:hypothetical protein ASG87_05480 [Frateuria sp. Soil773]|uniref:molybdopterin-dependent oxidoreductase n=1 Tax=Frateuria sp. Soil773 TaxID=1736407 RepID=UPI0006FBB589|nr:molybdopterin-dependent oxidoreductase [Frateuria sp. Soil773]KRE89002.1 hypothetical protein ASG87_05480 [Frateuria sp. Soil773]